MIGASFSPLLSFLADQLLKLLELLIAQITLFYQMSKHQEGIAIIDTLCEFVYRANACLPTRAYRNVHVTLSLDAVPEPPGLFKSLHGSQNSRIRQVFLRANPLPHLPDGGLTQVPDRLDDSPL